MIPAQISSTPRQVGLENQVVYFTTADKVRFNGWFTIHPQARATMIWFHGNAGNIGERADNISCCTTIPASAFSSSITAATTAAPLIDGEAAMNFVRFQLSVESNNLVIVDRSLGAAVAAEMAIRQDSRAVILESPFVSISELPNVVLPALPT